ncbi:ATP-binding protein [Candidatus Thiothrix sp. Deng01]|uniref:histidine kinase n=1 Tax=Candidatus Thiothrix phosphatis TaxID=3112415 RepID=A0ABU6D1M8_9GAMM|nr:ATP-binding protein [Candidatus Thiothrix sp. Deng01]MEB4592712.1 ATP-binding protein [Candidatus Thiothrix sp. Deng01]
MTRYAGYCLLLLLWLPLAGFAEPPELVLTDALAEQPESLSLLDYAAMLEDPAGNLALPDVLAVGKQFFPVEPGDGGLDLFLTRSAYWLRVDIHNLSAKKDWYFRIPGSLSRQVQVYLGAVGGDAGTFTPQQRMAYSRFSQYRLLLPSNTESRLYFRVQDRQAPLVIKPSLYSPRQMLAEVMLTYPIYSFVIGGLLTLAFYNLLYFFYLRDRSFLALSVFILGFVLEMGSHSGVWHYFGFVPQYLAAPGDAFGLIAIAAGISLSNNWMETRRHLPRFYRLSRLVFWVSLLLIPTQWWLGYGTAFTGVLALLAMPLFAVAVIIRYQQGFRFPFMLRTGVLLVLLGFIPTLLRGAGLIGDVPMLTDSMYFILLVALVMLSLTQAEQVRIKSEQAERIAVANQAKDEFLTTMSHELRTPMSAVVNAGRLLKLTQLSGAQGEYVTRLNTSAQHMLALINDILDLARLDSSLLRMESIPFRLADVLHQAEQLLVGQAHGKQLKLDISNQFHLLKKRLTGDPTRLRQVLLNLLNNAIKFTPAGVVSLTVSPLEVSETEARLLFEVRDTGIGISAKDQQKLFQPFSQVDSSTARQYGGSGLGLAISYKLVQRMGGELQVESRFRQGSCFYFTLGFPLQDAPGVSAETPAAPPSSQRSSLYTLLVDDDEMNRFFGGELIRSLGVKVEVADSGEQALRLLRERHFDLVFMDVGMPGLDGYATTRLIRADRHLQGLPVIALTAHAIAGERERCLQAGMDDYLTKPFEVEHLEAAVRHWSRRTATG